MTAHPPEPGLFAAHEARLAALDALARSHWLGGLTHSQGTLETRLASLVRLRESLSAGALPAAAEWAWPPAPMATALLQVLTDLELPRYCRDRQAIADTVVMGVLFHLDFIVDYQDRGASPAEALHMALEAFREEWRERCGMVDELETVLGLLPDDGKNMNWDQLRGLLRSAEWQSVLRIRRLLENLPELTRLIRALGRSLESEEEIEADQALTEQMAHVATPQRVARDQRVPDMPGETRGICRSDRIARMLPAEAMLLGHPRLRLVWHARRAERTLLAYEDDDHLHENRLEPRRALLPVPGPRRQKKRERGPIIVCVDTSGSMQGGAEAVAKAVVLEAMRTAHAQQRACHVIAFGGPDELIDLELSPDARGLATLTGFLGQAFRGGTDICGPLERVVAKLEETRWRQADLLIASDGEFGATPALAARLAEVKRSAGLRVQGVLIGDRETLGFMEIADDIHPVRDWRRLNDSGAQSESPVHTHRLTSLYFPGALRGEAHPVATPEAAAAAVRAGRKTP